MPGDTLTCDQAIFTSVRTPMGEGYRIIAASRGLSSPEKQAITRMSPSHGALCVSPVGEEGSQVDPSAASFYALLSGDFENAFQYDPVGCSTKQDSCKGLTFFPFLQPWLFLLMGIGLFGYWLHVGWLFVKPSARKEKQA